MRFLHLADLHLGKQLHRVSLLDDQKIILSSILQIASAQQVDAVLIAGDIYQRSTPPPEAMTLFSDFLAELCDRGLPCYLISGNHDSPERVAYLSQLAARSGVYIADGGQGTLTEFTASDAFGKIIIRLMPFCTPLTVRRQYPEEADSIRSYEDAVRTVLSHHPITDPEARHVLVSHQYLTGAETCDSEELAIGGLDNIPASLFDGYDYAALGHLHGPQSVLREGIQYAGSPLRYSFSEVRQKKSVTVAELREKGSLSVTRIPLAQPHGMQVLEDSFDTLMQHAVCEDFVQITLNDPDPPPDAARRLRSVFPNLLLLTVRRPQTDAPEAILTAEQAKTDFLSMLSGFFSAQNGGTEMTPQQTALAKSLLERMKKEEDAQ